MLQKCKEAKMNEYVKSIRKYIGHERLLLVGK